MLTLPPIDIVIIGLNSEKTLKSCLESVKRCQYPHDKLTIIYSDGGSLDSSLAIAQELGCAVARAAVGVPPTPGRQRNAGWRLGSAPYVQFLDSDTVMDPTWLGKAVSAIAQAGVGAVAGDRREMHPGDSVYNRIGDLEWNAKPGEAECFGGDALVSRAALEATGGYDPDLIAGEDPELSYRIRGAGYKIIKLAAPMTMHDLAMRSFRQYWKRAYRSGHAFAEVNRMHRDFWRVEVRRIVVRSVPFLVATALLPLAWKFAAIPVAWVVCAALLLRPRIMLVDRFRADLGIDRSEARAYAWHASLMVLPQFFGLLRFYIGKAVSRPLTNARFLRVRGGTAA